MSSRLLNLRARVYIVKSSMIFHEELEAKEAAMAELNRAEKIVRDLERVTPYTFEGLYGDFLRNFMDSDKSRWTHNLGAYLGHLNQDWDDVGQDVALLLWDRFEKRISC